MALADLLAELERDADAQIEAVVAEADAEAARVAGASARHLAARRDARLAEEQARLDADAARELRATRRETETALLVARRRALDRLFAAATRRLGEPAWIERSVEGLGERVAAALALAGDGEATVVIEPELGARLRALVAPRPEVRVEAREGTGAGFAVRARDGAVEVDDRWRSRLARLRPTLEIELARLLEEEFR
jgi:vacuolar-type H+-ATPase subunit E/Vma4